MTKFEELMRNKTSEINKTKTLNERKAILEKKLWSVYSIEPLNKMYVEFDTKTSTLNVMLNVKTGKVELLHNGDILSTFHIDVRLISIMNYDLLIKRIGFEIEKYDLF